MKIRGSRGNINKVMSLVTIQFDDLNRTLKKSRLRVDFSTNDQVFCIINFFFWYYDFIPAVGNIVGSRWMKIRTLLSSYATLVSSLHSPNILVESFALFFNQLAGLNGNAESVRWCSYYTEKSLEVWQHLQRHQFHFHYLRHFE